MTIKGDQSLNGRALKATENLVDNAALIAAENGTVHTNIGAGKTITVGLPAAVAGMRFGFYVGAAQELRIDPHLTETISLPSTGAQGAAGKYLVADAIGEWVELVCLVAGAWQAMGYFGTWTAEG